MLMFTSEFVIVSPLCLMVKSAFLFVESHILDGSRFKFRPSHVQTASSYLWQLSHGCAVVSKRKINLISKVLYCLSIIYIVGFLIEIQKLGFDSF